MLKGLHSLHFRFSALYTGVFTVSVLILGSIISFTTQNFLMDQLKAHVESGSLQLMGDYWQDGLSELRHDVNERIESEDPERLWYAISSPSGKMEFDPIPDLPGSGWHRIATEGHDLLLLVTDLHDGYRLGVAITLDRVHAVEKAVQRTFFLAILSTLLLGIAGAYLVSRGFIRRLETIKSAATRFGEGKLDERLSPEGKNDEFDQLSRSLNSMFSRIEQLVSEVQRVTSNIAHDLRSPLGRIKQKLEGLKDNKLPEEVSACIEDILKDVDATISTFSALLRIAEVESGTRKSGFQKLDLSEVVNRMLSAYAPVLEESGYFLQPSVGENLPIIGDQLLLTQMLANLVENIIQHTPPGTDVNISVSRSANRVLLEVRDTGAGIPSAHLEDILKPFFKVDRSRGFKQGSGLGLSLVAAIVKLHDAEMKIEDNNPGTRILIAFPLA